MTTNTQYTSIARALVTIRRIDSAHLQVDVNHAGVARHFTVTQNEVGNWQTEEPGVGLHGFADVQKWALEHIWRACQIPAQPGPQITWIECDPPTPTPERPTDTVQCIPLDSITPSFGNDRTTFDEAALQELAESIRTNGLAQPITVRPVADGKYQLIAGERRFRAHKLIGAPTIRAIVTPMSDDQAAAVMLVENTGRKDLDPIDEARAYARRRDEFKWDEKTIAERAGVGIQTVRNRLALLALRSDLQDLVKSGTLPVGYAIVIATAGLDNNRQMIALKNLNANPAPSVAWLRGRCSELAVAQSQGDMFDSVLFYAAEFTGVTRKAEFEQKLPADPRKDKAPAMGKTYRAMLQGQIEFWKSAAAQWDGYGKPAPRDRCLAAMSALQSIVEMMPATHNGNGKSLKAKDGKTYIVYEAAS